MNQLKHIRKQLGITQAQLADLSKVSRLSIAAMELQVYRPTLFEKLKLSNCLHCSVNFLMGVGQP